MAPIAMKKSGDAQQNGMGAMLDRSVRASAHGDAPIGNVKPLRRKISPAKVKPAELILFTTQLSVMLDSGVVLSDALDSISEARDMNKQSKSSMSDIISDISESVKGGENLSNSLRVYPKVFDSMFVSMVKASEASGTMSQMLCVLSGYLAFEDETRKRIKGALTYPIIMIVTAIAAMAIMMMFVLPRFTKIYDARGAALPGLTQVLVNISKLMCDFEAMTVIITTMILIGWGIFFWSKTLSGRKVFDYMKIHLPVIGIMFNDMVITRSTRILATMVNTGVNLLDAIEVIQSAIKNYYFEQLWADVDKKIRDGYQLSDAINISKYGNLIDPGIIQMLKAGEKSGKLGDICDKISVFYEKRLSNSIKAVTALIEPMMIVILGGVIGLIAIALLLPVFKISSVISH